MIKIVSGRLLNTFRENVILSVFRRILYLLIDACM